MKVSQNDQIRMSTSFTSVFLVNGTELGCFNHFQISSKVEYPDLRRNFNLTNFEVCLHSLWSSDCQPEWSNSNQKIIYRCFLDEWKRFKKIWSFSNLDLKHILGPEQKSWKLTNFEVCLHLLKTCETQSKWSNPMWTCMASFFLDKWSRIKKL